MFYKAIRPDGTSFHDPDFRWATEPGGVTKHPNPGKRVSGYLSAATVPTDCTGMAWPCLLLAVEPVGESWAPYPEKLPNKVAAHAWRTVEALDPLLALGPQGAHVVALIERCRTLTSTEVKRQGAVRGSAWSDPWGDAWSAVRAAARGASRAAAMDAAWSTARLFAPQDAPGAAGDAARALIVRDLTDQYPGWDQAAYDSLTGPWRTVIGSLHPDDEPIERTQP